MIEENTLRKIQEKSPSTTPNKTYYYPAEREDSCWGKGSFKPRFQKIKPD